MVALALADDKSNSKFSIASAIALLVIATLTVLDTSPGLKVKVPEVNTKS
jgi:hypothetical protein